MNDAVCPSISHTFFTMFSSSYRHEKFLVVITINKSDVSAKGQGQRSKVKVTGQKNFDPIWTILDRDSSLNHRWLRYNAQSLKWNSRSALLFVKVIQLISSMVTQTGNRRFWPKLSVSKLYLCFQFTDVYKIMHKAWSGIEEVPFCFSRSPVKYQGHTGWNVNDLAPLWTFPDDNSNFKSRMTSLTNIASRSMKGIPYCFFKVICQI